MAMETFTLDPRCWWTSRILGRNPLIRRTDRIEALVMLTVFVVSLLAVPVAGVAGTLTYQARDRLYRQEALERHRVTAVVTEAVTEDWGNDCRAGTLAGPLARYCRNSSALSPIAAEAAAAAKLAAECRNPFRSIVVRAVEVVYAIEETLRIIEDY